MTDRDRRHLHGGRAEIVGERPGMKVAALIVDELLHQRGAEPVDEAAVDLAFHDTRIELGADIVHRGIFVDAYRACLAIDLDRGKIDHEAERGR